MIIAGKPISEAKAILESMDLAEEDLAEAVPEEDMEDYQPLSTEETDYAIEQLRRFGLAVQ